MSKLLNRLVESAVGVGLSILSGGVFPLAIDASTVAQNTLNRQDYTETTTSINTFSDLNNNWASPFIQALAARNIIAGYPDGSFRPNLHVSRAGFAAMLQKAFGQTNSKLLKLRPARFVDVPVNHWAIGAIQNAYNTGFMTGYPGEQFRPEDHITKAQAIIALVKGLNLRSTAAPGRLLTRYYIDAKTIPPYAIAGMLAATQAGMVVDYPNVKQLNPNKAISRGEAAALLYQALVAQGTLPPITATATVDNYIVGGNSKFGSN